MPPIHSPLPGYTLLEILHNGINSVVYRGIHQKSQQPVIIKLLNEEYPDFNSLLKFRHQFNIIKDLDIMGVIKPTSYEQHQGKSALIMPDTFSIDLLQYLNKQNIRYDDFFLIAIGITKIIQQIHLHHIIHKDLKPENILIHQESKTFHIIDFSVSTLLSKEIQSLKSPDILEGTLAYMPPEQTGRMNRGIDYRSDFYSLGVTFYQLLTGQLPFKSNDAMELVHCHLAKRPVPPISLNQDISQPLNDIILKLMEKNAEDRYQSAEGLLNDFEICHQQWLKSSKIISFKLGQHDIARQFSIPEKLYGRDQEVNTLLDTFNLASQGQPALLLVTGLPGIGKTALVNEIHQSVVRERGYFIKGKYDQYNRNQPFFALIQSIQMLLQQLLNERTDAVQKWQKLIQTALGQQAQVIIDLIPDLEQLIGKQAPAVQLQGIAATNRFQHLLLSLFRTITDHHPLVMFLDDLQWIDAASLQLLPILMQPGEIKTLLLIGAYRDNEVKIGHPWFSTLQEIKQTGLLIEQIKLTPLTQADLRQMITDACLCHKSKATELTQLVYRKTQGNPFFTHRLMAVLHEEKLVKFDYDSGQWGFDLPQIAQLAANNDIIDFMVSRIKKMLPQTQTILQKAACIGNKFDLETLITITNIPQKDCTNALWQAMKANFIIPLTDNYKIFLVDNNSNQSMDVKVMFRFTHDRVQQAAYSMISENQKAKMHLEIGRLLKKHEKDINQPRQIIDITNQLNMASELIIDQFERIELATLNFKAGNKAMQATAYSAACKHFDTGISLLPKNGWHENYLLTLSLYEAAAESAYLCGNHEIMSNYADTVIKHVKTINDAAKIIQVQCLSFISTTQISQAIKYAIDSLMRMGINIPANPDKQIVNYTYHQIKELLKEKLINDLAEFSHLTDPTLLAIIQIINIIMPIAHANPDLFAMLIFTGIQLTLKYGNSPASILIYGNYGQILISQYHDTKNGYKYGQLSLKLLDQFNSIESTAQAYAVFYGTITPWKEPLKNAIATAQVGYQYGFDTGDYLYASVNIITFSMGAYSSGQELSQLNEKVSEYSKAILAMQQIAAKHWNEIIHQSIMNLLGLSSTPWLLQGTAFKENTQLPELKTVNDQFAICTFHIHKMLLSYLFQQQTFSEDSLISAEASLVAVMGTINMAIFHFYAALIQLYSYESSTTSKQKQILDKVTEHLQKMQNWAKYAPMNFQHKYDLMEAERCRVTGDWLSAEDHYEKAIQGAHENEFIQEEALANELAARFFLNRKNKTIAKTYMTQAYYAYANWGAKAKTDDLEKRYPYLLASIVYAASPLPLSVEGETFSGTKTLDLDLDLSTVMKCSRTLSGELSLPGLLEKILNIVMENAGAQRSVFLLNQDEQWKIAGVCGLDSDSRQILPNIVLDDYHHIPRTMIHYVIDKQQSVVLDDARDQYQRFHADPYFREHSELRSVLCLPFLSQGKLVGLLYLENNLVTAAFDTRRLEMLQMMSAQAAISIENSHLYETLEEKVELRTNELKAAQAELIKQAREAGMAEIAIGVMHNIGNALTPAKIGVSTTQKQLKESPLRHFLAQGLTELPAAIQSSTTLGDSEKDRFTQIIKLLPTTIKTEYDQAIDGLEKVMERHRHIEGVIHLQMKYTRIKKVTEQLVFKKLVKDAIQMLEDTTKKYSINVATDFSELPIIQGDENKLLQILINIIKNGCEAMSETAADQRQLTLTTELDESVLPQQIVFKVKDNGIGFTPAEKEKLFSFGYSTKERGSGFGLHACGNDLNAIGGSIEARSEGKGLGATFIIRLPV